MKGVQSCNGTNSTQKTSHASTSPCSGQSPITRALRTKRPRHPTPDIEAICPACRRTASFYLDRYGGAVLRASCPHMPVLIERAGDYYIQFTGDNQ